LPVKQMREPGSTYVALLSIVRPRPVADCAAAAILASLTRNQ
jgi:hypothetical protein